MRHRHRYNNISEKVRNIVPKLRFCFLCFSLFRCDILPWLT
jgi:hypothetical protein